MANTAGGFAISLENKRVVLTVSDGYRTWGEANGLLPGAWNHLIVEMFDPNPADAAFNTYVTVNGQIVLEGQVEGQHLTRPGTGGDLVIGASLAPTADPKVTTTQRPFLGPVSYTHLDVYKRQPLLGAEDDAQRGQADHPLLRRGELSAPQSCVHHRFAARPGRDRSGVLRLS